MFLFKDQKPLKIKKRYYPSLVCQELPYQLIVSSAKWYKTAYTKLHRKPPQKLLDNSWCWKEFLPHIAYAQQLCAQNSWFCFCFEFHHVYSYILVVLLFKFYDKFFFFVKCYTRLSQNCLVYFSIGIEYLPHHNFHNFTISQSHNFTCRILKNLLEFIWNWNVNALLFVDLQKHPELDTIFN